MIQFRHVTLSVCGRTLLHDLNWSLPVSGKAVICGASGSGKTSLLRGIAGFQQIESGTLLVDGIPVRQENLRIIRSRMAFLTQDAVPGADTVLEALMLPYTFRANRKERPEREKLLRVLDQVSLPESILNARCDIISGGERQRTAIARALLMEKKLLLADEFTSALDPQNRDSILTLLLKLPVTLLAVSHDPAVLERFPILYELEHQGLTSRRKGS